MRKSLWILLLLSTFFTYCKGDNSPWIWQIEGKKYTLNDFNDAYENYIILMAQQMQVTPEQLKEIIQNPEKSGMPQENLELIKRLKKEYFPEQYKQMILLNTEAEKTGYLKKKEIESRLKFIKQFYIASIYMADKADPGQISISDDEALKAWEMIRQSNPQARNIPLDKGIAATKSRLAMRKSMEKQQDLIRDIMESYTIKNNPEFKLKEYLDSETKKDSSTGEPAAKEAGETTK